MANPAIKPVKYNLRYTRRRADVHIVSNRIISNNNYWETIYKSSLHGQHKKYFSKILPLFRKYAV